MLLYWLIFGSISCFAFLEILCKKTKVFHYVLLFFIFIAFLLSFIRWETGTDWESYLAAFSQIRVPWEGLWVENSEFELGFLCVNHLAKTISESYTICLLFQAIILYSFMFAAIKENSVYPLLTLMIYYSMSLAGIFFVRQTIALMILFYSVQYILNRNFKIFLLWVIIASLFHRTAYVFLAAYPLYNYYFSWKKILIYIALSGFVGVVIGKILLSYLSGFEMGVITAKLNAYLDAGADDNATVYGTMSILIRGGINRLFLFIFYILYLSKERQRNPRLNCLININALGVVLFFVLSPIALSLGRATSYFDIVQILIIPYIFCNAKDRNNKVLIFCVLLLYSAFRLYVAISSYEGAYVPYKTIFS